MKKRYGAISDLHGKDNWKKFVNDPTINKWIFLADYCDSFEKTSEQIYGNLMDLIEFKKQNMDKVILLLGNHDIPYRYLNDDAVPMCSGFRSDMAYHLHFLFNENKKLFQNAYQVNNHLFSHAGISSAWYEKHVDIIKHVWEMLSDKNDRTCIQLADVLNVITETRHRKILFEVGESRGGSPGQVGGSFWSCYNETKFGVLSGYHHIVGHTRRDDIEVIKFDDRTSITYCDILDTHPDKFLTIEI